MTYGGVLEEGFSINPLTGVITTAKSLDRELQEFYTMTGIVLYHAHFKPVPERSFKTHNQSQSRVYSLTNNAAGCCVSYRLTVYAKDGGLPPNYAKATVRIRVLDQNDNAPSFGRLYHNIEVPENLEASPLFTLRATDKDAEESGEISYKITGWNLFFYVVILCFFVIILNLNLFIFFKSTVPIILFCRDVLVPKFNQGLVYIGSPHCQFVLAQ